MSEFNGRGRWPLPFILPALRGRLLAAVGVCSLAASLAAETSVSATLLSLNERYTLSGFPGEGSFVRVSDVAYDPENLEVLVADEGARRIFVFAPDGAPLRVLGAAFEIPAPSRIVPGSGGKVFLVESSTGAVFVVQRRVDEGVGAFAITGGVGFPEFRAQGIARSTGGRLYLVSLDGKHLVVSSENGDCLGSSGGMGRLKGFIAMDVDARGRVVVATSAMRPLHLFSEGGAFVRDIEIRDFASAGFFPTDIAGVSIDSHGRIWSSFPADNLIRVFDETGVLISQIESEDVPGGLFTPTKLELTAMDDLILLERGSNRVRCFSVDVDRW